ncbi:MAG: transcriptional regulator [Gammaproteobacteria bacterium]|nr:transcriptional regulator [Gammaproteobacteria bacterium]
MSTPDRLLYLLKTRGPQTAQALAEALGLSAMGARKQLDALADQDLVSFEDKREGIGRPARHWSLTAAGHGRFPDRHGDLTLQLLDGIRSLFGAEGMDRLIAEREAGARRHYGERLTGLDSLGDKVQALAELRNAEGYMAEAVRDGEDWLLLENHCPICAAATACQGFCRSELELFRDCAGEGVHVERIEHQLSGARRCAYRFSEKTR